MIPHTLSSVISHDPYAIPSTIKLNSLICATVNPVIIPTFFLYHIIPMMVITIRGLPISTNSDKIMIDPI